jgi:SAM-dependent methyltransferase
LSLKRALDRLQLLGLARTARDLLKAAAFWRRNAPYRRHGAPDGLPIPPARLVILVIGQTRALLDFGCGRVARHWQRLPGEVHGCDFNRRLVGWCRRRLRFGRFAVNALGPPLPYPDRRFDLVYALSVFTHLPEDLQGPWMDELGRVLAPGGHAILSVHGQRYVDELSPAFTLVDFLPEGAHGNPRQDLILLRR